MTPVVASPVAAADPTCVVQRGWAKISPGAELKKSESMGADRIERATDPTLGRYVTVACESSPDTTSCVVVDVGARRITLGLQSLPTQPFVTGDKLTCSSLAGTWTTTVLAARGDVLEVVTPAWLGRAARRRWRRVEVEATVSLRVTRPVAGTTVAARLQEVSAGGASLLLERVPDLAQGAIVEVDLPRGQATAEVRSVRNHAHQLLVIVGIAWTRLDPQARTFLATTGTGRRAPDAVGEGS